MSEHRRKPPNSGRGGGRHGAHSGRRGTPGADGGVSAGRRAAGGGGGRRRAPDGNTAYDAGAGAGAGAAAGAAAGHGRSHSAAGGYDGPRRRRRPEPPPRKRFIDYPRSNHTGLRRWLPSWKQVMGMCVLGFGALVGLFFLGYMLVSVPDVAAAARAQNNVYYWSDGTQMATYGGERNRQIVDLEDIPKEMQNAVIAAENATFYSDPGIDPKGITRAVINMAGGGSTQSGSTITQQYVKNAMLDDQSQTLSRKVKELFVSIKVGAKVDKNEILAGYLNTAYYGRGAYGIQAAAQAYFRVDAENLKPDQSAFLAAVLKGPDLYDPQGGSVPGASPEDNRKRAEERWEWILDRQTEVELDGQKMMSPAERAKYDKFPEIEKYNPSAGLTGQKGYLIETANRYVLKNSNIGKEELERGGYRIYTTFDKKKVAQMEKAVDDARKEYLDPKTREKDKYVQFGGASVDPTTGKIVALYGGEGFDNDHFTNNADTLGVPVGSTWKPFVLASAFENGTYRSEGEPISPESKYNGNNKIIIRDQNGDPMPGPDGEDFRQVNESDYPYGYVTLEKAMGLSINSPFVQLGVDVGLSNVQKTALSAGILEESMPKREDLDASFSLGTSTPSAIRMASAYATFAASGEHIEPYSVTKVIKKGDELPGYDDHPTERGMDANVADNVTKILNEQVVNGEYGELGEGTGAAAKDLGRPAAGKTGTTDENKSAWWVGYTPQLSTAVTLFRTDPRSEKQELLSMNGTGGFDSIHGGQIPTEIWTNYMKEALKGTDVIEFPVPDPLGDIVDGGGVPSPTQSSIDPEPTESEPSEEPDDPTSSPPPSTSPPPSQTCEPWDLECQSGGATNGGDPGGETTGETTTGETTGETTTGETTGETTTGGQPNGGNGNGGSGGDDGGGLIP
ncbi:penicillin-binding protein [Streptomyces sp. CNQ-509]|uniref:transglycosylase domain-containing protein n=1 Tax=Streptomyces sp. CNQ-509 TaxID=444103 RepID=UPI00062DF329|nr:transglycosylase domain-containing protein [Streptomyces sp. CNQ-509]AKH83479.1 penicillin-binding protein [Streptomyces sp. CNQ-509]